MSELFTNRVGNQIRFLEGAFVSYAKRLVMTEVTAQVAWLFAVPVLGPFANLIVGRFVSKILSKLARNAEFQLYFINTRRRADAQAKRFDDYVDARATSQTAEELKHAEELALKSFDDAIKYSS